MTGPYLQPSDLPGASPVEAVLERHLDRIAATEDVYNADGQFGEPEYVALREKALAATRAEVGEEAWAQWRNDKAREEQRRRRKGLHSRSEATKIRRAVLDILEYDAATRAK